MSSRETDPIVADWRRGIVISDHHEIVFVPHLSQQEFLRMPLGMRSQVIMSTSQHAVYVIDQVTIDENECRVELHFDKNLLQRAFVTVTSRNCMDLSGMSYSDLLQFYDSWVFRHFHERAPLKMNWGGIAGIEDAKTGDLDICFFFS